ncbi:hypothetical protein Daus18300_014061 [Diaporthe australafricana]|uniref:Ankyrin repeat protein n=1 Tax=Diaporthe australafricana TaxID=127596 RepID=A0ABR3VWM3_9PEZI
MLLEFRPQLDHEDLSDKTLLHFTSANTTRVILRLLVNAGAKVDGLNNIGESPISRAVHLGNVDAVRYLLTKPAARLTINNVGDNGAPLHVACRYTTMEMAKTLIDNGADVNLYYDDGLGSTAPISYACTREGDNFDPEKDKLIMYLLEGTSADITGKEDESNSIHVASLACSADLIRLFIMHRVDTQLRDQIGRRTVHLACYNSLEALEALNPSDQDFTARDKLGRVPLHFAVLSGQLDLLEHVLERSKAAGLDIDVTDNDGWTPLLWAARGLAVYKWDLDERDPRANEVTQFLLDNKADPCTRGHVYRERKRTQDEQWSAGTIAAYHGLPDLADALDDAHVNPSGRMISRSRISNNEYKKEHARLRRTIGEAWRGFYCVGCYLTLHGTYFVCDKCSFYLCFKCYRSKEALHPHHDFEVNDGETSYKPNRVQFRANDEYRGEDSLDDEVISSDEDL